MNQLGIISRVGKTLTYQDEGVYDDEGSYRSGRSYRRGRSYDGGSYRGGGGSYDGGGSNGGGSYHGDKEWLIREMERAGSYASGEREKQIIREAMERLRNS